MKFDQLTQMPQIDKSVFDTASYGVPKSDQIMLRLSENMSKFGSNYSQLTVVIMLLGGLTNLTFLIILGISCAIWITLMRNDGVLDAIPSLGLSKDKKKVVLFLGNVVLMYVLCGDSIFTYIGVGFMISFIHAFLFKSKSTDSMEVSSEYKQFGQVELGVK